MAHQVAKAEKWAPYALRLPVDLKQRLEQAAAQNGRSLNSEIVQRLKRSR